MAHVRYIPEAVRQIIGLHLCLPRLKSVPKTLALYLHLHPYKKKALPQQNACPKQDAADRAKRSLAYYKA